MQAAVRQAYAAEMRPRYWAARPSEKSRLLDEFTAVTGYGRKHAIMLLNRRAVRSQRRRRRSRYGPEVRRVLVAIWSAAGYPWSKRLVALLPLWLPSAPRSLGVTPELTKMLLSMSPRSVDRVLHERRTALKRRRYGRTKPGTLLKHQIPIRSERWDVEEPGWGETDTVAHCGGSLEGEFLSSVNLSDVASGWTETRAVLGKGQHQVVAALDEIRLALPFILKGIDSDSGSEFINQHCVEWCKREQLDFTRSRPYHKNDNAHVEQKNWTHVRKIFGWKRLDAAALDAMNDVYRNELRLLLNYFLPSVRLREKHRVGSRVTRRYDAPSTPFDRLVALGALDPQTANALHAQREAIDPFALSSAIDAKVAAILALPVAPLRPRPSRLIASAITPSGVERNRLLASAPVRSYVAR